MISPGAPTPTVAAGPVSAVEVADDLGEHVDQGVGVVRGRAPGLGDDAAEPVEHDPEALGAADVDAEAATAAARPRRPSAARRSGLGAVLSSRTELRMRTSARRLTKPGSGAASSIDRS